MKKILLTSGCSFTDKNFTSDYHHDLDTSWHKWPELLAKKLDMDCINLGFSGAGNEYIYTSLLNEIVKLNTNNIGLIMPAWSGSARKDWNIRGRWRNLGNISPTNVLNEGDIQYHIQRSIIYYYSLQEICKSNKLPLKQFQMLPMVGGAQGRKDVVEVIYNSPYSDLIDDNFLGWPTENNLGGFNIRMDVLGGYTKESYKWNISDMDKHPSAKGQEKIAEFLYERL
jgi:hypothetical protein